MAKYTFEQWKKDLRGTDLEARLKGLNPGEQQAVFKLLQAQGADQALANPRTSDTLKRQFLLSATNHSFDEYRTFKQNPTPQNTPDALAKTPEGKQSIAEAQSTMNQAPKGAQAPADAVSNFVNKLKAKGAGTWYPWMTSAAVDSAGNRIDVFGPDQNKPELTPAQQDKFRNAWNAAHPDQPFADNASFMASDAVIQGRAEAQAAFQAAFDVNPDSQKTYLYRYTDNRGHAYQNVKVNAGLVAAANDTLNGGTPALDKYMGQVIGDASANGVPWQILWGVLRARMNSTPYNSKGVGLFALDPSVSGTALSPEEQIRYLAQQLKAGYDQTGDWAFAALYTDSPQSAMDLFHTGHSSQGRTLQDGQYVGAVFGGSVSAGGLGTNSVSIYKLGFGQSGQDAMHTHPELIQQQPGGTGATGNGPTINLPDMNALQLQATQLIQQYLFRDPNPGEAEAMAARMRDALVGAQQVGLPSSVTPEQQIRQGITPNGNSAGREVPTPDPVADMTAMIKGGSDYQHLYANRPSGLTEADYANEFKNVESTMLGQATDTNALRQGLESGNVDAFSGYLFGNSNSNTTFRQRLYQIAQSAAGV